MNEQRIHKIFEASVLLKGAHAVIECIGGIALALASTTSIAGWVNRLASDNHTRHHEVVAVTNSHPD